MSVLTLRNRNNNNYGLNLFDDVFAGWDSVFGGRPLATTYDQHAPIVKDLEDRFEISLAAPGLEKKDFSITVEGSQLTIGYDVGEQVERHTYARKYSKTYTLPHICDGAKIEATYKSGILIISVPKSEEAKARQIKIN